MWEIMKILSKYEVPYFLYIPISMTVNDFLGSLKEQGGEKKLYVPCGSGLL